MRNRELPVNHRLKCLLAAVCLAPLAAHAEDEVDYARQIKPLLQGRCYGCHGATRQESDLRLDTAALAIKGGVSGPAVIAGKSSESLLLQAVRRDSDEVSPMPPDDAGPPLTAAEVELIRRWIDAGAPRPESEEAFAAADRRGDHWAFQPLERPPLPELRDGDAARNPIDLFVLARLHAAGLAPSPAADRPTLTRRLSLDLTGLPPTPEEVDLFANDGEPGAYGRLVERLLASPRYGERWGRHWLDQARYADSDGYTNDVARVMWPYRDWVIDAFNADQPFDAFTVEQLAGDLLPNATTDQVVATGFHRNTQQNREGGSDAEQYRVEAIVDRVSTTGVVFLGLTLGCARCHDHKYDPISQREFYQLFAFLNSQDEPKLTVPRSGPEYEQLLEVRKEIAAAAKRLDAIEAELAGQLDAWEAEQRRQEPPPVQWVTFASPDVRSAGGATLTRLPDDSILVGGDLPETDTYTIVASPGVPRVTALRLEVLTHESLPGGGPGWASNGNFVLNELEVAAVDMNSPANRRRLNVARAEADHAQPRFPITDAVDGVEKTGWAINLKPGTSGSIHTDRTAVLVLEEPWSGDDATRLEVTLRHNNKAYLIGRFRLAVTSAAAELVKAVPDNQLAGLLATPKQERSAEAQAKIVEIFQQRNPKWSAQQQRLSRLQAKEKQLASAGTVTTLVMQERSQPRETFVHIRGDFLRPGRRVTAGVPDWLHPLKAEPSRPTRLDLARWLVATDNPLTARVTVNRIWQQFFGRGLVETENDFGRQSAPPSHPQLLDWLAAEFISSGWQMKRLHRLIAHSETYRQASHARADLLETDPNNRLLARQNRLRLEAEAIRDSALAAAGVLSTTIKGPSVFPPQPDGVMTMTRNPNRKWNVSEGEDRYRRGMYTYFWRSTPHPFLKLFNAPESNTTCTRRDRSNTPLQALTLLNDEAFYEAAQALAARILRDAPSADPDRQIAYAFTTCLGRQPSRAEAGALRRLLAAELAEPPGGEPGVRFAPASNLPDGVDAIRLAAWTSVARVLLNTDEFITRE